jgi:hypothetical protein
MESTAGKAGERSAAAKRLLSSSVGELDGAKGASMLGVGDSMWKEQYLSGIVGSRRKFGALQNLSELQMSIRGH